MPTRPKISSEISKRGFRCFKSNIIYDYMIWADILLRSIGLPRECLKESLKALKTAAEKVTDPESYEMISFYIKGGSSSARKKNMCLKVS